MWLVLLLLATWLNVPVTASGGDKCHKIVTSNVGLTGTISGLDERVRVMQEEYANSDADIICAQEFWHEEHMASVIRNGQFAHHFSHLHQAVDVLAQSEGTSWLFSWLPSQGTCRPTATLFLLLRLVPCALRSGCLRQGDGSSGIASCLVSECGQILKNTAVSSDCIGCVFMNLAASLADSIYFCHSFTTGRRYNSPGLLLLSKKPIESARYVSYFPGRRMMLQRGYLEAQIQDVGTVVCTHLSSRIGGYYEYDLPFDSYQTQQRNESQQVMDTFQDTDHILLGDFNTGPEVRDDLRPDRNLTGEFPDNFDHFMQAGYECPYLTMDGRCTLCTDNPLANGYPNVALDHVMLKGSNYDVKSAQRIMDDTQPTVMSDHYAVQVNMCH